MNINSRLLSPFQSLEKVLSLKNCNSEEAIQQCRSSTTRILGMLNEQGQSQFNGLSIVTIIIECTNFAAVKINKEKECTNSAIVEFM